MLVNVSGLNKKIGTVTTKEEIKTLVLKAELKAEQDKIVKRQIFNPHLFIGQSYFDNNGAQLSLIFQPIYKTITFSGRKDTVSK